ncbi:MAG: hypothetical protein IT374_24375 [Polyangiaceae bacterium]|nr:hypothetical protein [Polyangiaceae bacterium]
MRKLASVAVEFVVVALALLAAFTVPMGKRTLAGHAAAVFTTPAARAAARDVTSSVRRVFARQTTPSGERSR